MTLDALLLETTTRQLLNAYSSAPKHALLLSGADGVGLHTIATSLAGLMTDHQTDITEVVPDEKRTISIEQVRMLYIGTRDKRTTRQVVIIDDLDAMSFDAQNAFLKLLEEPTEHTYFILTTHMPEALLPTITSRTQRIEVRPVDVNSSRQQIKQLGVTDATAAQQMLFLAQGLPAKLTRLARDTDYFEAQAAIVRSARAVLSEPIHERLTLVSRYTDRSQAIQFVAILGALIEFMLKRTPTEAKLLQAANLVELTAERLVGNAHVRTQLMNLVSQLS